MDGKDYGTSDHPMTKAELLSEDRTMAYGQDTTHAEVDAVREQYTDNVTALPKRDEPAQPDLLIGPFQEWRVVVDGRL